MLKVATPSLQAEQILASDYEPGKHYLKGAWPGVLPFYLIQASPLWYKVLTITLTN